MDLQRPMAAELVQMADHLRLLAALLLKRSGLQDSERQNIGLVLYDLAERLERICATSGCDGTCRLCTEKESRH
ncbi:MAG: hypothetical protein KZQ93_06640 [Candidatus Thiodiazotropha sp. (ex Monitilora ramsayi)]|nr:hypothetical protein [Candidatus Thiodiazotropha sp. (ex Monitilora ramsayi)]